MAQRRRDRSKSEMVWGRSSRARCPRTPRHPTTRCKPPRQRHCCGGLYAPTEEDSKSDQIIARWTRVLEASLCCSFLVTAALAALAYRADETSRASERAFVGVKDVKITALGPEIGKNTPDFLYRIDTECENSGDTQTRNLTIDANLSIPYMETKRLEWQPKNAHDLVILPKQVTNCSFNTVIDAISLNSMKGNNSIGIMGIARYDDGFITVTSLCFVVYCNPRQSIICLALPLVSCCPVSQIQLCRR